MTGVCSLCYCLYILFTFLLSWNALASLSSTCSSQILEMSFLPADDTSTILTFMAFLLIWFIFYMLYFIVNGRLFHSFEWMTKDVVHPSENYFQKYDVIVYTFVRWRTAWSRKRYAHCTPHTTHHTPTSTFNVELSTRLSTPNNLNNVNYASLKS